MLKTLFCISMGFTAGVLCRAAVQYWIDVLRDREQMREWLREIRREIDE